jgi:hypothetical protein
MFKQMKDMKQMVNAAPGMVQAAQETAAEAQRYAAAMQAQQAAAFTAAPAPAGALTEADLAPIANVTLDRYAEVSRGLAAYGYDTSKAATVAAGFGISSTEWYAAVEGWNARMATNPAVAREFNRLYTGR